MRAVIPLHIDYIPLSFAQSYQCVVRRTLLLDPNSRELKFYSKINDLTRLSSCVSWSPEAYGKNRFKCKTLETEIF